MDEFTYSLQLQASDLSPFDSLPESEFEYSLGRLDGLSGLGATPMIPVDSDTQERPGVYCVIA